MKQCIKCGLFKEMSEFYANHRMNVNPALRIEQIRITDLG